MTLLATLVDASQRVDATAARLAKVWELAVCLRALDRDEIQIGVQYLTGETPQGRFGLGYAVPEIVAAMQALPVNEVILDGEAIAFNAAGRPHPFQITMRRFGRKLEVAFSDLQASPRYQAGLRCGWRA